MKKKHLFLLMLCCFLFISACSNKQTQNANNPMPTMAEEKDESAAEEEMNDRSHHDADDEVDEENNDIDTEGLNGHAKEYDVDDIFKRIQPSMSKTEVIALFGEPSAETYSNLLGDFSIEWRYDFGKSDHYVSPLEGESFSYVDEQGLKSGEITAQVFIGWNDNDTVKYAEVNYFEHGELITEMIYPDVLLKENQFFVKTIREGDVIAGMTVESIEFHSQGAATVYFDGDIELSGTYRFFEDHEKGIEQYDLYILLDEQSFQTVPAVYNRTELTFGVTNADDFMDLIEQNGKEGRFKGTFTNYVLQHVPHKPAENWIDAKELYLFPKD